jgi:HlyD family secretion protein
LDLNFATRGVIYIVVAQNTHYFAFPISPRKLLVVFALFLLLASGASLWWINHAAVASPESRRPTDASPGTTGNAEHARVDGKVGCRGHIEPKDGVLQVSAPYMDGRPQRVIQLKVKQGDHVRAGQVLAVLDGNDELQNDVRVADAKVRLAQARLAKVKAGSTEAEIAAQKAEVDQLQAVLENARSEYRRYQGLEKNIDVSQADLDARALAVTTAELRLQGAQQHLKDISQVRSTNLDIAESELKVATAESELAHSKLDDGVVRAPIAGQVLQMQAYEGEEVGTGGVLTLGRTDSMYIEAEVYETDITAVRVGQRATITSDLFPGEMAGVVETVGTTLTKNEVLPLDPVAFADARVFRVWIRLDDGQKVADLIHGKVDVVIQP